MQARNNARNKRFFFMFGVRATMVALRVRRKSMQRRYRDETKALFKLAPDLPDRPSPDDIHDLRVTARRIQVIRGLLPRRVRESQSSRTFDLALKSVLKSTSQLRDMDTLMDTLKAHMAALPSAIMVALENQRSDAAARARAATSILTDVPAPDFERSEVGAKELSRRLRKRVKKRSRAASELLTEVLNDESRVQELHSLRKEIKKLRYLLELVDGGSGRLPVLTKWQGSLGAIHDLDVAVSYLQKTQFDSRGKALLELNRARHADYLKFVGDYRATYMEALAEGERLSGVESDQGITAY